MPKNIYIHIPFCLSKCKYCSFVSFNNTDKMNAYVDALNNEIKNYYLGEEINTLYIGGGTPSLLPIKLLKNFINNFSINKNAEVTIEANPDSISFDYLCKLKQLGFNRISMGAQTFDDNILKLIGRRHNSKQIVNSVQAAKKAGFSNISLDLIYGLPNQTLECLKRDLDKILSLDIQHISTYGLKIEENSYFGSHKPQNLPDDDKQADMYLTVNKIFENSGFMRYEVSNFAKKGYESRHNLNYWNNNEYYGFGLSAHGYKNGIRYSNTSVLDLYIENPCLREKEITLSEQEKLEEEIFLGFRKTQGIDIEHIKEIYNVDFREKYKDVLSKYAEYIQETERGYKLTLKGTMLSNIILSEFIQ